MTDEEKETVTNMLREAIKSAREQVPKKSNLIDKMNLGVTVMVFLIGPVCWLLVSQKIDLRIGDVVSGAKDTYVDKPTFGTAISGINDRFNRQEQHIDTVDTRENADKSMEDLKIQSIGDRVDKGLGVHLNSVITNPIDKVVYRGLSSSNSADP